MFRNQYDTSVTLWSPQGRLFQVEYAMEAVKQGSCAVGIAGKEHAIIATLHRTQSELSSSLNKVFKIDDHLGIAVSGVASDGRHMCRFMRDECLNHKYVYESDMPVGRLVRVVADKNQDCTMSYARRPFGLGLLVVGYDTNGPCLYETCPTGQYWQCQAMALGARSQAAKTYLERNMEAFPEASLDELIKRVLAALHASQQDGDIKKDNVAVAVVGKGQPFTLLSGDTLEPFVTQLEAEQPAQPAEEQGAQGGGAEGDAGAAAADDDAAGGDGAEGGDAPMDEA